MTKRLLQLAAGLIFAGLVMGAAETKSQVKVGDYFVYQKTSAGKVEVKLKDALNAIAKSDKNRVEALKMIQAMKKK